MGGLLRVIRGGLVIGFFNFQQRPKNPTPFQGMSLDVLHKKECAVCPLNNQAGLSHPHMEPAGTEKPIIYILGEAPGGTEDARGKPFVGKAGQVLRFRIPGEWLPYIRWSNVVRTRPPDNRTPTPVEIECCRPSVIRDIERTKPVAIFGFGDVALRWALNMSAITNWSGRRVPIKVGSHTCWYYPMVHPSYVMRDRKFVPRRQSQYGSENEFAFAMDLKRAFAEVDAGLPAPVVHTPEMVFDGIEIVTGENGQRDVDRVRDFLNAIEDDEEVGIDYETWDKDAEARPYREGSKILSVALSSEDHGTMAIALEHRESKFSDEQLNEVWALYRRFLMRAKCRKISHNLAFELEWSAFFLGREVVRAGKWDDTMSQAYILDERPPDRGNPSCQSLEFLCIQYFGVNIKQLTAVNRKNVDAEPLDKVLRYNGVDAKYHRLLFGKQWERLEAEHLIGVYESHLRRVPTMVLTQLKGVPVDAATVEKYYGELTKKITAVEAKIKADPAVAKFQAQKGKAFKPSSNPDVAYLFRKILRQVIESTDAGALEGVDHPLAALLLEYREHAKIRSTYVEPLREGSSCLFPGGLLHPMLSTTKTRTWRTSSEDPNSQNFPKRENKWVRSQVKPKKTKADLKIVAFDYAGIQARNVAMESLDAVLVKAFWDRYDIHRDWMYRIVEKYPRWVDVKLLVKGSDEYDYYRYRAKNQLVFPSFFGAQPRKIASGLGIPEEIAAALHEEFWDMFPDIKGWHERILKDYRKFGYVTGKSGHRRRAPISPNEMINAPIQADESIIVCDAMARLSEMDDLRYQANLEIHDDLTFIWPKKDIERNAEIVIAAMLDVPFKWAHVVPIQVEMAVGDDWASTKGVGEYSSDTWDGTLKYVAQHE